MLKGTALYEILSITGYWYRTFSTKTHNQIITRYGFGPHSKHYFMVFSPLKIDTSKPVILYYHGGGWLFGKPEIFAKKAAIFNKLGYQIIIPCYRKLPWYNFSHIREDLNLALQKIQVLKNEGVLKFEKIILGGTSAGGNLVSLIYYQQEFLRRYGFSQDDFIGLFLTAPPMDLSQMKKSPVLSLYAGKSDGQKFKDASPINFLESSKPIKLLCIHGTKDGLVNFKASKSFLDNFEKQFPHLLTRINLENYGHIQSASWAHTDNSLREELIKFIQSCH